MNKFIISLFALLLLCGSSYAQNAIAKKTFTYTSHEGKELKLDKYSVDNGLKDKPCIIFMFGGGFANGERDSENFQPYFQSLVNSGNVVVSIDYRLGLKGIGSTMTKANEGDFVKVFANTINMATQDLMDATTFVIFKAEEWGVDKKKIIVSGSSAGAITALHGEYAVANRSELASKLPEGFRYAGVVSFAGAILSLHGDLEWKNLPAPMLLFHGNADSNVPYNAVELGYLGFYGSKYIASQLDERNIPYYFYDEEYGNHSVSDTPMHENLELINTFIKDEILEGKGRRIHSKVKVNGREPVKTTFSISDYIKTNFAPAQYK